MISAWISFSGWIFFCALLPLLILNHRWVSAMPPPLRNSLLPTFRRSDLWGPFLSRLAAGQDQLWAVVSVDLWLLEAHWPAEPRSNSENSNLRLKILKIIIETLKADKKEQKCLPMKYLPLNPLISSRFADLMTGTRSSLGMEMIPSP